MTARLVGIISAPVWMIIWLLDECMNSGFELMKDKLFILGPLETCKLTNSSPTASQFPVDRLIYEEELKAPFSNIVHSSGNLIESSDACY